MSDWISVKDRLPDEELAMTFPAEKKIEVIVMIAGANVSTALYWDGEVFEDQLLVPYKVTHWMPLPKPPEEGETGVT